MCSFLIVVVKKAIIAWLVFGENCSSVHQIFMIYLKYRKRHCQLIKKKLQNAKVILYVA